MQQSISAPGCSGINHADFSIDGRYAIFTCEFRGGGLVKIDLINRQVLGYLRFSKKGMPQDIRISPDGSRFYVADMHADGVYVVDGSSFKQIDFIPTGVGTHGLYPSRDGTELYVANRGSHSTRGTPHGKGSVTVIDTTTSAIKTVSVGKEPHGLTVWPQPGRYSLRHTLGPALRSVARNGREDVSACFQCQRRRQAIVVVGAVGQCRVRHRSSY